NTFTGSLPTNLCRSYSLKFLSVDRNKLFHSIPLPHSKSIGVEVLCMPGNKLEGTIP
ncbi:hypothetical protein SELMODRAFT_8256, partial [Selaginella moellendorffii]